MSHLFTSQVPGPVQEAEELLYILTHDLKAFARAMRTIPDWIDEDLASQGQRLPSDAADNLAMLRDYAYRLDDALSALTELSRVGRLADPPSVHDLQALVASACTGIPQSTTLACDIDCQGILVFGPLNDLRCLFDVLVDNVVVHHDRDFGALRVAAARVEKRIRISLTDDGPGVPDDQRDTIFKPLSTLRPKSETGRAGVGLAIARKIVRSLGGEINVAQTDEPRGLSLVFDLPAADATR